MVKEEYLKVLTLFKLTYLLLQQLKEAGKTIKEGGSWELVPKDKMPKEDSITMEELPDSATMEEELIAKEVERRINELKEQAKIDALSDKEQDCIDDVKLMYTLLYWYQKLVDGIKQVYVKVLSYLHCLENNFFLFEHIWTNPKWSTILFYFYPSPFTAHSRSCFTFAGQSGCYA